MLHFGILNLVLREHMLIFLCTLHLTFQNANGRVRVREHSGQNILNKKKSKTKTGSYKTKLKTMLSPLKPNNVNDDYKITHN